MPHSDPLFEKATLAIQDAIPQAEKDPFRPVFHFRPPARWMNDPNGLIWHDGVFHLYYQSDPSGVRLIYNGAGAGLGWGHATSTDLVHWTKVKNAQPLFQRGPPGQWDQGAIWFGEVFEHEGRLYMLYEGWGWKGLKFDRTKAYAKPGRSQVGIASIDTAHFLKWCDLSPR